MPARSDRRCTFRPTPFDLRRFRRGLSGLSRSVTASGFDAGRIPLCGLPFSSKLSPSRLHPHTHADAPLLGFSSPTALDNGGRPYSPMALQSHRHSPSSGFLDPLDVFLRPPPYRTLDDPLSGAASSDCAPGVPPDPSARTALASGQGRPTTGFLSKALPNPATSAFSRALLSCASPSFPHRPFQRASRQVRRALQSLDRRTVGVFRSGELRLPAFLRFLG